MSPVSCERHPFDVAHERCRSCRNDFCEACLVYTHGPKRPPLCIPCALVAAGIRQGGNRPHTRRRRGLFGRGERELVNAGGVPAADSAEAAPAAPAAPEAAAPPPPPPPPPAAPTPSPVPVGDEEGPTVIPGLRVDW